MVYITTFNALKNFAFCDDESSCDEPFLSFKMLNSLVICRCEVRDAHVFITSINHQPCLFYEWCWNPKWCLGVIRGWWECFWGFFGSWWVCREVFGSILACAGFHCCCCSSWQERFWLLDSRTVWCVGTEFAVVLVLFWWFWFLFFFLGPVRLFGCGL